ncbi:hypothetical protein RDWZM_002153 [Blomia tropicalis]|uniref:Uncharacterized protein n=1 Tax=Blomia tropicalis TaxID=40697 RepID=A0A9Q0MC47_BLOTA|nr:hypothetical protein RDWZM_002153 [Blomia tropicalis]
MKGKEKTNKKKKTTTVHSKFGLDQYDNIASVTNKGIELLDKYGQFTKELSAIETDYAGKLRRLVKNYMIKKKDDEENMYTVVRAFNKKLSEINDIAGQHEIIAEELLLNIVKEISILLKELKDERKRYLSEGTKLQNNLHSAISLLDKSKRNYEKAFRESAKANENYHKADDDLNLSRAEVEKARLISVSKNQMCDDTKSDYATHLQRTNEIQRQHYQELMPKVFHQLQDMEERRAQCIRNYIQQSALIRRKVLPIVDKCIEGMIQASEEIDPREDSRLVIERYKSGVFPPDDFPFEDLSNPRNGDDGHMTNGNGSDGSDGMPSTRSSSLHHTASVNRSETIRGTLSAARFRKRGGIFGIFSSNKNHIDESKDDFSDLPPNQRRKRIQQKIDLIQSNIQQETAVREALIKMKNAFEQNVKLGDPQSVNGQLNENSIKLDKLQTELHKYQSMLQEVMNGLNCTPSSKKKSHSSTSSQSNLSVTSAHTPSHRNSISDESLSRSESETSVNNGNGSLGNGHIGNNGTHVNGNGSISNINGNGNNNTSSLFKLNGSYIGNGSILSSPTLSTSTTITNSSTTTATTVKPPNTLSPSMKNDNDTHLSINDAEFADEDSTGAGDDDEFEDSLAALGTGKALYPFEGLDEGSIKMAEGEEFEVVELDQGDGWTRVRRMNNANYEEGFVPTSYIECVLFEK